MNGALFLFLAVGSVALFSFVAVAVWSENRRKEREAFYRSEVLKKVAETQGTGAASALDLLREQEMFADRRRRGATILGGLVNIAVGLALMIFLRMITNDAPVYLCGLIPLFIGIALVVYAYLLAPKA
jgi:hypothetical protein